jgi:hypothetical protein
MGRVAAGPIGGRRRGRPPRCRGETDVDVAPPDEGDVWIYPNDQAQALGLAQKSKSADGKSIVFIVHYAVKGNSADPGDSIALSVPNDPDYRRCRFSTTPPSL